jgi:hypothetical protein
MSEMYCVQLKQRHGAVNMGEFACYPAHVAAALVKADAASYATAEELAKYKAQIPKRVREDGKKPSVVFGGPGKADRAVASAPVKK